MSITENIKNSIKDGKPDQTIDYLLKYGEEKKIVSIIVSNIAGEYNRVKKSYLSGVLTPKEYSDNLNRINSRILALIHRRIYPNNYTTITIIAGIVLLGVILGIINYINQEEEDPFKGEKIKIYMNLKDIVIDLSANESGSEAFQVANVKLEKMLNGGMSLLKDTLTYNYLIEYYYDLEQLKRGLPSINPIIQQKSNYLSKHIDSILININ